MEKGSFFYIADEILFAFFCSDGAIFFVFYECSFNLRRFDLIISGLSFCLDEQSAKCLNNPLSSAGTA